jgi:hypothetical protein
MIGGGIEGEDRWGGGSGSIHSSSMGREGGNSSFDDKGTKEGKWASSRGGSFSFMGPHKGEENSGGGWPGTEQGFPPIGPFKSTLKGNKEGTGEGGTT